LAGAAITSEKKKEKEKKKDPLGTVVNNDFVMFAN